MVPFSLAAHGGRWRSDLIRAMPGPRRSFLPREPPDGSEEGGISPSSAGPSPWTRRRSPSSFQEHPVRHIPLVPFPFAKRGGGRMDA